MKFKKASTIPVLTWVNESRAAPVRITRSSGRPSVQSGRFFRRRRRRVDLKPSSCTCARTLSGWVGYNWLNTAVVTRARLRWNIATLLASQWDILSASVAGLACVLRLRAASTTAALGAFNRRRYGLNILCPPVRRDLWLGKNGQMSCNI
jgi:hypothetical protein